MFKHLKRPAILAAWFTIAFFSFAQDAVNPCEILTESINCTAPGMHGAEIDFKTIKLNGKRKTNPMEGVGDALVISTGIRYTKRAKVELTTTFNGGCPPRTETKRIKPDVNVTYTATLDGNSYSGSGAEFTLNAPLAIGSYPLVVNFTAAAANGCIDNAPITTSKTFLLDVIDGAYILNLTAQKTGTAIPVAEGTYLCKGQGQQLDFTVTFSDPLANLPFSANDIVWTVSPPDAGSFTGSGGANGDTVTWTQADDFVSALEDDLVITVNAPDMQPRTFALTVFGVNSTSGVLAPNSTQTFLIENVNIEPADANKSIIVAALGGITDVGTGTATKLRTRTFTGASPFGQLESEIFLPAEGDQTNPALQIIKKATFMLSGSDLMVEIQSGPVVGDVNITWEQDRPGGTRQILHREHMTVTTGMPAHTVTLIEKGSNKRKTGGNVGPLYKTYLSPLEVEAIIDPGPPVAGYPKWTITHNLASGTVSPPADGATELDTATWLPGHYLIETKLGNDPAEKSQIEVNVVQADLDVDTNRNGTIADDDDAGEDSWSNSTGAIFAVNYDDDDYLTNPETPDSIFFDAESVSPPGIEDYYINGPNDLLDVAEMRIAPVGSKSNVQYFLKVHNDDLKAIHIFSDYSPTAPVLNNGVSFWSGWEIHKNDSGDKLFDISSLVDEQGPTRLGIEPLFFKGFQVRSPSFTFDGRVTIELLAKDGAGTILASDMVVFQVAPFLLLPNHLNTKKIFVDSRGHAAAIRSTFGSKQFPTPPFGNDQWFQDHVQIGYTGLPGSQMHITLRMPYNGNPAWPIKQLFKSDHGLLFSRNTILFDGVQGAGDLGGNLEMVPPSEDWPLGRVLYGNNMSSGLTSFLNAQDVGGDALQKPFDIEIDWLGVGHVDEAINFAPGGRNGFKVVQADTNLAKKLLQDGVFGIDEPDTSAPVFADGDYLSGTASNTITTTEGMYLFDGVAHGHITCLKKSQINDGATVTLIDGTHTVVFEFDKNGSSSPSIVAVDISAATTATLVRNALKAQIDLQVSGGNLTFQVFEDGSDGILLIHLSAGLSGNHDILETVSNTDFVVKGMTGGEDPGSSPGQGVDFSTPMSSPWNWVRLISGTAKGQVARVLDSGDGWLKIDSAAGSVFKTTSKLIWNPGNNEEGLFKFTGHYPEPLFLTPTPITLSNKWFTEPDDETRYVVVKACKEWLSNSSGDPIPALWSVEELLAESELWQFNSEAQAFIDAAVTKIQTEMGMEAGGGTQPYLLNENDYLDDHIEDEKDDNDDFISVPVIYMGARNTTIGGTAYPNQLVKGTGVAYTPGFANFQPAREDFIVFPKPFMPKANFEGSMVDIFEKACRKLFDTNTTTRVYFAENWDAYHRFDGEIHCATADQRVLFDFSWWSVIP